MNRVMGALSGRLAGIMRRGHIDERRLDAIAEAGAVASPAELDHLQDCRRCRSLLAGFRRTEGILGGAWADRPLNRGVRMPEGTARVRLGRPAAVVRSTGRGVSRRAAIPTAMVAILVAVVATAGLVTLRGAATRPASSSPAGSTAGSTPQGTPPGTGLVARLPLGQYASFEWSPDDQHLLVSDEFGKRRLRPIRQTGLSLRAVRRLAGRDPPHLRRRPRDQHR